MSLKVSTATGTV